MAGLAGIEPTSLGSKPSILSVERKTAFLVVDKGFEPFRCSPSDHSPGLIRPSRTPVLSTIEICGSRSQIWTDGFRDLQSLALGLSAIRPLVLPTRIELVIQSYQDCGIPLTYRSKRTWAYISAEAPAVFTSMLPLPACLELLLDGQQRNSQQKLVA